MEKDNHHIVSLIWGTQDIVKEIIRKRRGTEWEKLERKTNHERLLTLGNKQRAAEGEVGRGMGKLVIGIKKAHDEMSTGHCTMRQQLAN